MGDESIDFRHIPINATHGPEGIIDKQLKLNAIRTTKYTILNWLPKSILEQFRRVANAYFLGISVLMILGSYATYLFISPLDPFSTIATLTFILLITSCKEGYEDLLRRRSDKYENNKDVTVFTFEDDGAGTGSVVVREHVKRSKYLHPGEIVKLSGKMPAPADLLLILTSMYDDGNKCYIETANIDGETNLKLREAPTALGMELPEQIAQGIPVLSLFRGTVEIEPPNANIHKVVGTLKLEAASHAIPIDEQNIVLRSALFSNTDWAYGIVVYTGQETKIQMNSMHAPSKMSKLEQNLNTAIIIIFVAQVVLVSISVLSVYLMGFDDTSRLPYVFPPGTGSGSILPLWLELWFVFFLLYNNFIPLSLYVTIEIVNLGQSFLIGADEQLYNAELDVACTVRASNLVQELGMVSNVFTDKTGTLTKNEMKLVKFVLQGRIYDVTPPPPAVAIGGQVDVNTDNISPVEPAEVKAEEFVDQTYCLGVDSSRNNSSRTEQTGGGGGDGDGGKKATTPNSRSKKQHVRLQRTDSFSSDSSPDDTPEKIEKAAIPPTPPLASNITNIAFGSATIPDKDAMFAFLRGLMTCHTVVRESNGTYRAESPDELALVQGASGSYSCQLLERGSREMRVRVAGREHSYAILAVNAFNSDRKRMSVLLRDCETDQHLVVCKGADNIMLPLCSLSSTEKRKVDAALLELANLGLRTLVIAERNISSTEALEWLRTYRKSTVATVNREEQIAAAGAQLESGMQLVGVTAIEDKLQDEVPEVISDLAKAGIIVWMLTGDKLETAVNIGRSCNLLQPDSHTLTLANMTSRAEFAAALQTEHAKLTAAIAGGEPEPGPAAVGSRGRRVHGHSKRTGRTAGASIGARAGAAADEGRNYAHHTAPSVLACASPDGSSISIGIDSGTPSPSAAGAIADESIVGRMGRSISETFASTEEGIGMRMRRSISDTLTATAAAVAAVAAAAQSEAEAARNTVLILDGPSFAYFDSSDPVQCAQLLGIGRMCRSVIACRLTPLQKRELVALTKNDKSVSPRATTLSIGDGANDVSMILEANVGVGIFGKEGRQAANNADFAIGEFKFLRRLLLVHGRYNYIRQSKVFLYSMHKNMVLTMTLFWFSFFTAVSGASPYESWVYSGFNFILGLPIIYFGILDRDLSPAFVQKYPYVYSTGRLNVLLNVASILQWIGNAMVYAVVVCLMYYNILYPSFYYMGLYTAGTIVMIGLVLALQCKVMFFHHEWAYPQVASMAFSVFAMFLYYMLIAASVNAYWNEAIMAYMEKLLWLWSLLTVPLVAVFIDWVAYFVRFLWFPTREMLFREFEKQDHFDDLNRLTCCSKQAQQQPNRSDEDKKPHYRDSLDSQEEGFSGTQAGVELTNHKPSISNSNSDSSSRPASSSSGYGSSLNTVSNPNPSTQYSIYPPSSPYELTDNPAAGGNKNRSMSNSREFEPSSPLSLSSNVGNSSGLDAGSDHPPPAAAAFAAGTAFAAKEKVKEIGGQGGEGGSGSGSRPSSALLTSALALSSSAKRSSKSAKIQPSSVNDNNGHSSIGAEVSIGSEEAIVTTDSDGVRGAECV